MKNFLNYVNKFDAVLIVLLGVALIMKVLELDFLLNLDFGVYVDYLMIISAVIGTAPVLYSAYKSILEKQVSVDLLASVALVFSLLSKEWMSAVFINLMLTSARIFMSYNEARARKNIDGLLKLKPKKIKIKRGENIVEVDPKTVAIGDFVIVDLGERIPVDGLVVSGEASVDESSLTGESLPVNKVAENKVFSSTLIKSGSLVIKAEKVGAETTLEKIIELVEKAQLEKPDIHTSAEKFATWYLLTVFLSAIVVFAFTLNVKVTLAVLLVVCADDIAVAVPLTFLTAISYCAKKGMIIKGASYLEAMHHVKTIYLDKTGTITKGNLRVEHFECLTGNCEDNLRQAGMIAILSDHPISKAILAYAEEKDGIVSKVPDKVQEVPGKGLWADFGPNKVILGRPSFVEDYCCQIDVKIKEKITEYENQGLNITVLAFNKETIGFFALADEIKNGAKEAIARLKSLGVEKIIMLTGDNERVAKRIADTVGLTGFHANLLPEQKLDFIRGSLNDKTKVAMVGDGVNDAAALSLADVGIAMGGIGMDAAIESANIVLMKDDFSKIPDLVEISKYVLKISNQDFYIWGASNVIGLGLVFIGVIGPTGAAIYNFLTDFAPLINSTRIFRLYFKD